MQYELKKSMVIKSLNHIVRESGRLNLSHHAFVVIMKSGSRQSD